MTYRQINTNVDDITALDIPLDSVAIILCNTGLKNVPEDFFLKFNHLESIELQNNNLTEMCFVIPPTVTFINMAGNKLDRNSIKTVIPETVETIDMTGNPYHNFTALQNAGIINYGNVTVTNQRMIAEEERRVREEIEHRRVHGIERFERRQEAQVVVDVHHRRLQENVRKSIEYLLRYNNPGTKSSYIKNMCFRYHNGDYLKYMNPGCGFYRLLKYYTSFDNDIVYDYENDKVCQIGDLLNSIWNIAKDSENCSNIIGSLRHQLEDGEKYCFVGKYTRVLNSMTSFDDNIVIDFISNNEKISNEYSFLKTKGLDRETMVTKMTKYMDSIGIIKDEQGPWIDAVNDEYDAKEAEQKEAEQKEAEQRETDVKDAEEIIPNAVVVD